MNRRAAGSILVALLLGACEEPAVNEPDAEIRISTLIELETDSMLHDVRDAHVDGEERIWVLSGLPPHIRVYAASGRLLGRFGQQGQGPEELRAAWNIVKPGSAFDGVEVWDQGGRRTVRFAQDGASSEGIPVTAASQPVIRTFRQYSFGEPVELARLPDGYVMDSYNRQVTRTADLWSGELIFLGPDGSEIATFGYGDLRETARDDGGDRPFVGVPVWAVCPDGRTAVLVPGAEGGPAAVHWLGSDGMRQDTMGISVPDRPVTPEDIERYVQLRLEIASVQEPIDPEAPEIRRLIESTVRDLVGQLPRPGPVVRVLCDPDNRLWIELFSTERDARGYSGTWKILDAEGVTVTFPAGFHVLDFGPSFVVGMAVDSLGVETPALARYPEGMAASMQSAGGVDG